MDRFDQTAPSLGDFEEMARDAFRTLPAVFRNHCTSVVVRVADFAPDEVLRDLGIEDAFELTGLYQGVPLTWKSHGDTETLPDTVWIFRRAVLDEWAARRDVALDRLIVHVLVHEIAHHFGMSDEDIAAIDDWRL